MTIQTCQTSHTLSPSPHTSGSGESSDRCFDPKAADPACERQLDRTNASYQESSKGPAPVHQTVTSDHAFMPALINCLPPEILAYILESAVTNHPYMVPPSRGRTNVAFCNLIAVSRYWREVAIGHGPIWSTLSVTVDNSCSTHHLHYLEALLHRFGGSNLSVEIGSKPKLPTLDVTLLDALLVHSHRISHLDVKSTHVTILERLNSRKGQFPSLSRVTASIAYHPDANVEWTAFEIAPSLESLSLYGGAVVANGAKSWYEWNLPYRTLKKLSVTSIRAEDCCRALAIAPCLEELIVNGYFYTDGSASTASSEQPELLALHTYEFMPLCDNFDDTIAEVSTRIAASLVAPNLQTLRCHADNFRYFAIMCASSRCALKTLELRSVSVQNEDNIKTISSFLRTAATLENLAISFTDPMVGDGEQADTGTYTLPLGALVPSEDRSPTLPRLRTLQVNGLLMTEGVTRCLKRILIEYGGLQRLYMDIISASRHFQFLDYPSQPTVSEKQVKCWEDLVSTIQAVSQTRDVAIAASFSDGNDFNKSTRS